MNATSNTAELFTNGMAEFVATNYAKSIDILTDVIGADPDHKLALSARGSAYLKLNDLDSAKGDFDRVIEIDPAYARGYHLRGLVREKQGDDKGALDDFDMAISLSPEYGAAYYSRATIHTKMGDTDRASDDIEMVTHLTNRNIEEFANENNVWRSQQLRLESMMETDLKR